jgi:hypothetical protein
MTSTYHYSKQMSLLATSKALIWQYGAIGMSAHFEGASLPLEMTCYFE